jgi:hypothetical protein
MATDNVCFYLQNRLIQEVNSAVMLPPLVFPGTSNVQIYPPEHDYIKAINAYEREIDKLKRSLKASGEWQN